MSEQLPILYSFRRCPYAMRARMALRYSGIRCELREVVLRDKPPEMLAASPKGTVPVLLVADGHGVEHVVEESLDVMRWALAQRDPDGWLNIDRKVAEQLTDANDEDFKVWLDRYKYPEWSRDGDRKSGIESPEPWNECARFLRVLEDRLCRHACLMGDSLSYVDAAIFPFIRQFAYVDIERFNGAPYTQLQRWLAAFLDAELFTAVMNKYPAWKAGDERVIF